MQNQFTTARDWPFGAAVSIAADGCWCWPLLVAVCAPRAEGRWCEARLLAIYAAAAYAFLHLPLVMLAVFSFNASRFTVWEGFLAALVSATFPRCADMAEAAWNSLVIALVVDRALDRRRHALRLRAVEARLARWSRARCISRW